MTQVVRAGFRQATGILMMGAGLRNLGWGWSALIERGRKVDRRRGMSDLGYMNHQEDLARPDPLSAQGASLLLDLDGTIAPIMPQPHDVVPLPARTALMRRLRERFDGRLAIVSGRTIAEVDRVLQGSVIAVAGVHGLERRAADGRLERARPDPALDLVRAELPSLLARYPGLSAEDKGLSVTLHYRAAPDAGAAVQAFAEAIAARTNLVLQPGDHVAELRGPGAGKGAAIRAFMKEAPFAGTRPIYLGDDRTDEDGFAAVSALGGVGVLVGAARRTAATRRLADVDAVMDWLSKTMSGNVTV
jgi:trehalose 6-phosphate phosphatase